MSYDYVDPNVDGPIAPEVNDEAASNEVVVKNLTPKTRRERLLAKIAGNEDNIQPKSRTEKFLNAIAENSNGGGGILDLYVADEDFYAVKPVNPATAYKDPELEQTFESYEEALSAIIGSSGIRVHDEGDCVYFPHGYERGEKNGLSYVVVYCQCNLKDFSDVRAVSLFPSTAQSSNADPFVPGDDVELDHP